MITTLSERKVGVRSLTNGMIDTTTAHGKLVFGIFALLAEYEAALNHERTNAGLPAARTLELQDRPLLQGMLKRRRAGSGWPVAS